MRSGTVIALIVSFCLGIASTIATIAWFMVASENVALRAQLEDLNVALANSESAAILASRNHAAAKSELENTAVTIRALQADIDTLEGEQRDFDRQRMNWNAETENKIRRVEEELNAAIDRERGVSNKLAEQVAEYRKELRQLHDHPEVRLALNRIENRKANDIRESRKIKYWVYKKEVATETPAGKRVINTDYVVVFDSDGDGVFSTDGEFRRDGQQIRPIRLGEYELHRTSSVLPERMGQIKR